MALFIVTHSQPLGSIRLSLSLVYAVKNISEAVPSHNDAIGSLILRHDSNASASKMQTEKRGLSNLRNGFPRREVFDWTWLVRVISFGPLLSSSSTLVGAEQHVVRAQARSILEALKRPVLQRFAARILHGGNGCRHMGNLAAFVFLCPALLLGSKQRWSLSSCCQPVLALPGCLFSPLFLGPPHTHNSSKFLG